MPSPVARAQIALCLVVCLPLRLLGAQGAAVDVRGEGYLTRRDAASAAVIVAVTALAFTVDRRIAEGQRDHPTPALRTMDDAAGAHLLPVVTRPDVFFIGGLGYVYGRLADDDAVAGVAVHSMEAVGLALLGTGVFKVALGRAQPVSVGDSLSHDFSPGRGLRDAARQSFPSGHAAVAFAVATSVTEDVRRRWPRAAPLTGALLYGSATIVSASRLSENHHWLSDIVFGAGMGALTGNAVSRYTASHPHNKVDAVLMALRVAPTGDGRHGVMVMADLASIADRSRRSAEASGSSH